MLAIAPIERSPRSLAATVSDRPTVPDRLSTLSCGKPLPIRGHFAVSSVLARQPRGQDLKGHDMIHQDTAQLWQELAALCTALEATEPTEGANDDN